MGEGVCARGCALAEKECQTAFAPVEGVHSLWRLQSSIALTKRNGGTWRASFTFDRPSQNRVVLDGMMDGYKLRLRLRRVDLDTFRLLNSRFRWVRPPDPFAG